MTGTRVGVVGPILPAVLIALLAGCYHEVSVQSILDDRPRHVRARFLADHIPFAVNRFLPPEGTHPRHAHRLVVTYAVAINDVPSEMTCTTMYLERGVVTTDCELDSGPNGTSAEFEISYLGLLALRAEVVAYDAQRARPIAELLEVSVFPSELIEGKPDTSYRLEGELGLASHQGKLSHFEYMIKSQRARPAAQLVRGLSGQAVEVEVAARGRLGMIRDTRLYLVDYGVALRVGSDSEQQIERYQILRISIDGSPPGALTPITPCAQAGLTGAASCT